jgi:hypothetical protein
MAMIPPDAGVRLRMDTEASLLQPIQPSHEIAGELPALQAGQTFTARILETLPNNLFRALVAGKALTLQLPEGAKAGDTMELVVADRTETAIIARRAEVAAPAAITGEATAASTAEPYPYATLSRAAQMIGQLLVPEGETPQPAPLNGGQPLLPQPPLDAAELVPTLAKAVSQSGLFYEAHQAQWVAGAKTTEALRQEPQAQQNPATAVAGQAEKASAPAPSVLQALFGGSEKTAEGAGAQQQAVSLAQSVPDPLRPLVQQQLDAVATQRLAWQGEVWPGQFMNWEIERERIVPDSEGQGGSEGQRWSTRLRLTMPRLGTVDARLQLTPGGITIRLAAADDAGVNDLRLGGPMLAESFSGAGLRLIGLDVRSENG